MALGCRKGECEPHDILLKILFDGSHTHTKCEMNGFCDIDSFYVPIE